MICWTGIPAVEKPVVLTVGNFDGIHIGHQALFARMRSLSAGEGYMPVVVTFASHPLQLIDPGRTPPPLMTGEEKKAMIREAGAAHMVALPFDAALAATEPEAFIGRLLESMNIRHIVVGFNFRFGRGGAGDGRLLSVLGTSRGFGVTIVPPVIYEGEPVSSTRIRAALARGDCRSAGCMLGRPYGFGGVVIPGRGVGRTMGFPTANIEPDPGALIPGNGVYASGIRVAEAWYGAMTDIGLRPTARRDEKTAGVESHLFGLDREIYAERVRLVLLERIRDERFFDGWDALRDQLRRDGEAARRLLKDHHFPSGIV